MLTAGSNTNRATRQAESGGVEGEEHLVSPLQGPKKKLKNTQEEEEAEADEDGGDGGDGGDDLPLGRQMTQRTGNSWAVKTRVRVQGAGVLPSREPG